MTRWLRSLQAQLFLWAVLPVTLALIALAFTGVYAHQRAMRDFVAERDRSLAFLLARIVEDSIAYGLVGTDGKNLAAWIPLQVGPESLVVTVVDGEGRFLVHPDPNRVGQRAEDDPIVATALARRQGAVTLSRPGQEFLQATFAPVGGSDWIVIIQEPVENLTGPILRFPNLAFPVALAAGLLSLIIFASGWTTIIRPLQNLARAADQISWGDFSAISRSVGGVQEIRDLHRALNEMAGRIQGYQAGMQDYIGAITRSQEEERARLARDLHDGPVQNLIALGQRAEMAQRMLERGDLSGAFQSLAELRSAEREVVAEIRRLVGTLRPVYLEDLGFLPALEALVAHAASQTEARLRLKTEEVAGKISPAVELAAYRIVQEALHNAVRHAHAQNILLSVRHRREGLTLSVTDDGVGFHLPARPDELTHAGHFGLVGMRERALLAGGTFQIHTTPGAGTEVTVHFPASVLSSPDSG